MIVQRDITGVLLAGGHSKRMGRDKALLPWRGSTLLQHCAGLLESLCASTYIISGDPAHVLPGIPRIPDLQADKGPLGGILTGFNFAPTPWICVLACDMPLMEAAFLARLLPLATESADAILFHHNGRFQPLAGLYQRTACPVLSQSLAENRLSLQKIIPALQVKILPVDRNLDPQLDRALTNVNSPEEWARIQSESAT